MTDDDRQQIYDHFKGVVNLTPSALRKWLGTEHSKEVGPTHEGDTESVGHHSGRRIVEIQQKKKADLTDDDYAWMRKVVGYVRRHSAQRPEGDVTETRWRYSLMNWGHDPLKD